MSTDPRSSSRSDDIRARVPGRSEQPRGRDADTVRAKRSAFAPAYRTPFSIIVTLAPSRGFEIVRCLGERGDDLMSAALALDSREVPCRRILPMLNKHELHTLAAGWLPLTTRLDGLSRAQLIELLAVAAGE